MTARPTDGSRRRGRSRPQARAAGAARGVHGLDPGHVALILSATGRRTCSRSAASPAAASDAGEGGGAPRCTATRGYYALTFDDGPSAGARRRGSWRRCADADAVATFFDVGERAAARPDLVELQRSVGQVANHSYSHARLPRRLARPAGSRSCRRRRGSSTTRTPSSARPTARRARAHGRRHPAHGPHAGVLDRWTRTTDACAAAAIASARSASGPAGSSSCTTASRRDRRGSAASSPACGTRHVPGLPRATAEGVLGPERRPLPRDGGEAMSAVAVPLPPATGRRGHRLPRAAPAHRLLIPAHDEEAGILAAMGSVEAQTLQPDRRIVISDNSTDRTVELARSRPGWEVWETVGNRGRKGGALNQAWALLEPSLADRDYVRDDGRRHAPRPGLRRAALGQVPGGAGRGRALGGRLRELLRPAARQALGALQMMEYARAEKINRSRRGVAPVLAGAATMFSVEALRSVYRSAGTSTSRPDRGLRALARPARQRLHDAGAARVQGQHRPHADDRHAVGAAASLVPRSVRGAARPWLPPRHPQRHRLADLLAVGRGLALAVPPRPADHGRAPSGTSRSRPGCSCCSPSPR